jgi:hypothetical protein
MCQLLYVNLKLQRNALKENFQSWGLAHWRITCSAGTLSWVCCSAPQKQTSNNKNYHIHSIPSNLRYH